MEWDSGTTDVNQDCLGKPGCVVTHHQYLLNEWISYPWSYLRGVEVLWNLPPFRQRTSIYPWDPSANISWVPTVYQVFCLY